jgi:phospholipid transport system substrate-binding protein
MLERGYYYSITLKPMKPLRPYLPLVLVLFCSITLSTLAVGAERTPTDDLRPILDALTEILNDETLKGSEKREERRETIMAVISCGFDFREMSKRVLGKTWREISEQEQDQFTVLMTKLLENVYLGKLEGYTENDPGKIAQSLEYIGESVKEDRAQVSVLLDNAGVKIPVHYIMRQEGPVWVVYDINIEGVSLVRNYQEQFRSILRTENFSGLVKVIEEKNQSFLEEAQ